MTSHVKMCTNGYLFERLKVICLSYAFKINRMQFKWLRLLIQKNIPPCEWLLQSIRKYSSVRTAEVFNSEKYSIGKGCPWIWQREFDQILASITLFSQNLSWLIPQMYCSADVKKYVISFNFVKSFPT